MDASWLLLVVSAAVFVALVLLVVVCLDCRKKGPLVSIRETDPSDEYIHPPPVTHPFAIQPTTDLRSIRTPSLLSPVSPADSGTHWRTRPVTPTETESNPSYENPGIDGRADSDAEDTGYIIVLPDNTASPSANQSRGSTPSLDQHDYENVPEKKVPICSYVDEDYLNVVPEHFQKPHLSSTGRRRNSMSDNTNFVQKTDTMPQSSTDEDDDDDDDSDDDKGNYVNEIPSHIHHSARRDTD